MMNSRLSPGHPIWPAPGLPTCEQECCYRPGPQGGCQEPEHAGKALGTEPVPPPSPPSRGCDPWSLKTSFVKKEKPLTASRGPSHKPPSSFLPFSPPGQVPTPGTRDLNPALPAFLWGSDPSRPTGVPAPCPRSGCSQHLILSPLKPNYFSLDQVLQVLSFLPPSFVRYLLNALWLVPSFVRYLLNTLWLVGKNATDYIHLAP